MLGKAFALGCALLWAVAVILFKRAGDTIRPVALNWYKTALVVVLLAPCLASRDLARFTAADLLAVAGSGLVGIVVSDTLFFMALERLGASLSAIVDCFYAPFVMFAAWAMLGEAPRTAQLGGALLVIAALLVVAFDHGPMIVAQDRRRLVSGFLLGAAAMAAQAVSVSLMRPVLDQRSAWVVTELRALAALAGLTVIMVARADRRDLFASLTGHGAWRHALPGSFLGNVLSMTLWVAAFKYTSVNSAAILNQTSTILVVILATWLLKEPFTRGRLAGTLLAFSGAALVLAG